ncbi:MAG: RNA polymerase sigma factor [Planctomycetota bacterium]
MSAPLDTTLLLDRWHGGDAQALDRLLEQHLPWIERRVRSRLGPLLAARTDAHDLVQETLLEFLRYGPRFRLQNGDHFRALLARIAENALRHEHDRWAAQRRQLLREHPLDRESVLCLDGPSPSQLASANEDEAWLRLALELLPAPARALVVAHDFEARPHAEIARRLGVGEPIARKRYQRAVQQLAGYLGRLRSGALDGIDAVEDRGEEGDHDDGPRAVAADA